MKKICYFLCLVSVSLLFASCEKEDDDTGSNGTNSPTSSDEIVGVFKGTSTGYQKDSLFFNADYSGTYVYGWSDPVSRYDFTWRKEVNGSNDWYLYTFESDSVQKVFERKAHHFTVDQGFGGSTMLRLHKTTDPNATSKSFGELIK